MCGRFVSATPPDLVAEYFGAEAAEGMPEEEPPPAPRVPNFNVAPTTDVLAVWEDGTGRWVSPMHWGLVPRWAKDVKVGNRMINARAETLAERNAYKAAFRARRCIIPADGFYEWKKIPGRRHKQPYYLHRADGEPLAFAGLWETWRDPAAPRTVLHSCTIITTAANDRVAEVHDRMPAILPPRAWDTWLDPAGADLDLLGTLLVPAPASLLELRPVGTAVNNVRNHGADLLDRIDPLTELDDGEAE